MLATRRIAANVAKLPTLLEADRYRKVRSGDNSQTPLWLVAQPPLPASGKPTKRQTSKPMLAAETLTRSNKKLPPDTDVSSS